MTTPKLTQSNIRTIAFLPKSGNWVVAGDDAPGVRALAKAHTGLCEIGAKTITNSVTGDVLGKSLVARLTPAGIAVKAALEATP